MTPLTIVMYHYVRTISGSCYPRIKGLELESFKRQLDYLQTNYNVIDMAQLVHFIKDKTELPLNPCLLTFDDGYKDHSDNVLPELLNRKIQGSFFPAAKAVKERELLDVNKVHFIFERYRSDKALFERVKDSCFNAGITKQDWGKYQDTYFRLRKYDSSEVDFLKSLLQYVLPERIRKTICDHLFSEAVTSSLRDFADELYMSLDDVRELVDAGMYVGSHGYNHDWLSQQSIKGQQKDLDLSIEFLSDIGAPIVDWVMCYPYGAYNADTLKLLRSRNCLFGLTIRVGVADIENDNLLELPRLDTNDLPQ